MNPEDWKAKPEMEAMSDEFIQYQIDYFRAIGYSHMAIDYSNEKYRREQMAKIALEMLMEE